MSGFDIDSELARVIAQVAAPIDPWAKAEEALNRAFGKEPTDAEAIAEQVVRVRIADAKTEIERMEAHLHARAVARGKRDTMPGHHAEMIAACEEMAREERRVLARLQGKGNPVSQRDEE